MKTNFKIFILIILVGIFTVLSFVFDQMVIHTEDKIREKNFLYKQSFNNYLTSKNVMFNTRDLMTRASTKLKLFQDRQTFLQDTVQTLFNESYRNEAFGVDAKESYINNLKTIFTSRYQKLGYDIIKECNLAYDFFKGVTVRSFNFDNYKEEKIITALKGVNKINLENSIKAHDHFTKKLNTNSSEIISIKYGISNLEEFYIIREKYTKLLDFYFEHYNFLQKINEAHGITFRFYLKESNKFFEEKNDHETERNFYILFSVLSQILSLFFLIFLFKTLMKISDKKLNVKS